MGCELNRVILLELFAKHVQLSRQVGMGTSARVWRSEGRNLLTSAWVLIRAQIFVDKGDVIFPGAGNYLTLNAPLSFHRENDCR